MFLVFSNKIFKKMSFIEIVEKSIPFERKRFPFVKSIFYSIVHICLASLPIKFDPFVVHVKTLKRLILMKPSIFLIFIRSTEELVP